MCLDLSEKGYLYCKDCVKRALEVAIGKVKQLVIGNYFVRIDSMWPKTENNYSTL